MTVAVTDAEGLETFQDFDATNWLRFAVNLLASGKVAGESAVSNLYLVDDTDRNSQAFLSPAQPIFVIAS
jgi:hypothetical protein